MQLQDKPEAPVVTEVTDTSIEVTPEDGQEYAIEPAVDEEGSGTSSDAAKDWQKPDENGLDRIEQQKLAYYD